MKTRTTPSRTVAVSVVGAVLAVGSLAACGSDSDDESAEDKFCAAGDSLRSNISGIADIDIVSGGTDAITEQVSAIQTDVDELRESGADVAADEVSALQTAIDELDSALSDLGGDISVESAQAVGNAVGSVVTSAGDVIERLDSTCS